MTTDDFAVYHAFLDRIHSTKKLNPNDAMRVLFDELYGCTVGGWIGIICEPLTNLHRQYSDPLSQITCAQNVLTGLEKFANKPSCPPAFVEKIIKMLCTRYVFYGCDMVNKIYRVVEPLVEVHKVMYPDLLRVLGKWLAKQTTAHDLATKFLRESMSRVSPKKRDDVAANLLLVIPPTSDEVAPLVEQIKHSKPRQYGNWLWQKRGDFWGAVEAYCSDIDCQTMSCLPSILGQYEGQVDGTRLIDLFDGYLVKIVEAYIRVMRDGPQESAVSDRIVACDEIPSSEYIKYRTELIEKYKPSDVINIKTIKNTYSMSDLGRVVEQWEENHGCVNHLASNWCYLEGCKTSGDLVFCAGKILTSEYLTTAVKLKYMNRRSCYPSTLEQILGPLPDKSEHGTIFRLVYGTPADCENLKKYWS